MHTKWEGGKITFLWCFCINFGYLLPHPHLICKNLEKNLSSYYYFYLTISYLSFVGEKTIHTPMWCMLAWDNTCTLVPSLYIFVRADIIFHATCTVALIFISISC